MKLIKGIKNIVKNIDNYIMNNDDFNEALGFYYKYNYQFDMYNFNMYHYDIIPINNDNKLKRGIKK